MFIQYSLFLLKLATIVLLQAGNGHCYDFHRNTTGVAFSAYVHNKLQSDLLADWSTYTLEDVKTMMKVMSGRYSKIATFGVGSIQDQNTYQPNVTYYQSFSQVYTGEAAALVNKEMSGKVSGWIPLQVYLGIWLHSDPNQLETEIHLALESAEKANTTYRNTVRGFVFNHNDLSINANLSGEAAYQLMRLRKERGKRFKLGLRQNCDGLDTKNLENPSELIDRRVEMVKNCDFVICQVSPETSLGPASAFSATKIKLLQYKQDLKALQPSIEVMGETKWPGRMSHSWQVTEMKDYWQLADKWAAENNFTMWMFEAFDNPWKNSPEDDSEGQYGWWKLTDDSKTRMTEGYIEKAIEVEKGVQRTSKATTPSSQTTATTSKIHEPRSDIGKNTKRKPGAGVKLHCGFTSVAGIIVVISLSIIL